MRRRKSTTRLLTLLGVGVGTWAAARLFRRRQLAARQGFFDGKVALVTGASMGIGEALALEFARRGADVVLAARSVDQLKRVAADCERINPQVETLAVPTDVSDEAQLQHLVDEALRRFGRIDVLVNNAGIMQGGDFPALERESLEQTLDVNLLAPMRLAQLVLPGMLARNAGTIVNMASLSGYHAMPFFIAYSTSKGGLIRFGEALRRELLETGVQVVTISPGYIETQMVSEMREVYHQMGILKFVSPETVARRTLDAVALGRVEIRLGPVETFGAYFNSLFPGLTDLYWRFVVPLGRFRRAAYRQHTE